MLANLVHTLVERSPADAVWALQLRLAVPGVASSGGGTVGDAIFGKPRTLGRTFPHPAQRVSPRPSR